MDSFDKTRNDLQEYDWISVFKSSEERVMRHLHVATMAVVTEVDGENIKCIPFPIRNDTEPSVILAYNVSGNTYTKGDQIVVIFTDRDFRMNRKTASSDETSISQTDDSNLHSMSYGIVVAPVKGHDPPETFDGYTKQEADDRFATKEYVEAMASGNYNNLSNKPQIESNELVGNKSFKDLGLTGLDELDIESAIRDGETTK